MKKQTLLLSLLVYNKWRKHVKDEDRRRYYNNVLLNAHKPLTIDYTKQWHGFHVNRFNFSTSIVEVDDLKRIKTLAQ